MTKLLPFPRRPKKMKKKLDVPTFKLFLKHRKLITNAMDRGYSPMAIVKLVKSAEASKK
jgi:hypothetical protein